ncbi:MAG: TilS substrate C-terminal domain-containing protein [Phycisphaerales bacterium JB050]
MPSTAPRLLKKCCQAARLPPWLRDRFHCGHAEP